MIRSVVGHLNSSNTRIQLRGIASPPTILTSFLTSLFVFRPFFTGALQRLGAGVHQSPRQVSAYKEAKTR